MPGSVPELPNLWFWHRRGWWQQRLIGYKGMMASMRYKWYKFMHLSSGEGETSQNETEKSRKKGHATDTPQMEMGNGCQDTFIGSKSLSVNKSRVPSVKKVPEILKKFHHIQSTHVFHLRNLPWFALELVEIWDPKRPQLCHQSEALGRYHCFRPSRAAQSHWTGTHFHVSRRRGWMVFLQGWMSWEVTMTDVCRWFRWYPMFLRLHFETELDWLKLWSIQTSF